MSNRSWFSRLLGRKPEGEESAPAEPSPTDAAGWARKGMELPLLARYKEAVACFDRGLEIHPRDSDLWHNKGAALAALGRTREADECARRARELGHR